MNLPANLIYNGVKAGLGNVNKAEVTHKISELSKNTKMFARQAERSKLLDSQIDELKYKLQFATPAQLRDSLNEVNAFISSIEKKRSLDQVIFHADLDAFFAAVETLLDPSLKGIPFAVGGSIKHGVVSTSSYEARQFGVRSGMAMFIALSLCPDLKIVTCHFDEYVEYSQKVQRVFAEYDSNFTSFGLDEAALNMTEYLQRTGRSAYEVAQELKDRVFKETQLTISIGISPNYQLSKIASDINKPNGIFEVPNTLDEMLKFISDLPVRKIPGIGGVSERKLQELHFEKMGDILERKAEVWFLFHNAFRRFLFASCVGAPYSPQMSEVKKSYGKEETFEDTDNIVLLIEKIERISAKIGLKLQRSRMSCKRVTVKFKTYTFINITRSHTFDQYTSKIADIRDAAIAILLDEHRSQFLKLRLIGVRVSQFLMPGEKKQLSLKEFLELRKSEKQSKPNDPSQASNAFPITINQQFSNSTDDEDQDMFDDDNTSESEREIRNEGTNTDGFNDQNNIDDNQISNSNENEESKEDNSSFVFGEFKNEKGESNNDLSQFLQNQTIESNTEVLSNLPVSEITLQSEELTKETLSDIENNSEDEYDADDFSNQKREDDLLFTNGEKAQVPITEIPEPVQVPKKKYKSLIDSYFDKSQKDKREMNVEFKHKKKSKTVEGTLMIGSFFGGSNSLPKAQKSKKKKKCRSKNKKC